MEAITERSCRGTSGALRSLLGRWAEQQLQLLAPEGREEKREEGGRGGGKGGGRKEGGMQRVEGKGSEGRTGGVGNRS
jgi:hypothetical protein